MRIQIASACVSAALAGVMCESACAQSSISPRKQRYRAVFVSFPVNDPCNVFTPPLYGFAINDCGDVTGETRGDGLTCPNQPFVWTLCDNAYQLPARTSFNLAHLSGSPTARGVGYDINNSGVIVGASYNIILNPSSDGPPWVWELLEYDPGTGQIPSGGSYALDASKKGKAHSINDTEDSTIVGVVYENVQTPDGSPSPFRFSLTTSSSVDILPLPGGDQKGFANHVVTPPPSEEADGDVFFVGGSIGQSPFGEWCSESNEAVGWTETSSAVTVTPLLEESNPTSSNFNLWGAVANTANPQGESAGYRRAEVGFGACDQIAILWDKDGLPFELGLLPPLSAENITEVLGMSASDSNGGGTILVGRNENVGAILWWRNPSTLMFDVIHASDLTIVYDPSLEPAFHIQTWYDFVDVNSRGWILGHGKVIPQHPVVLVPDPCPADLSADGVIDGADLGLLLAGWGQCSGPGYCQGDLNLDDQVNGADLGLLLAAWGACPEIDVVCTTTSLPCDGSGMTAFAGGLLNGSDDTLTTALEFCGFTDLEAFAVALSAMNDSQALAVGEALYVFLQYAGGEE